MGTNDPFDMRLSLEYVRTVLGMDDLYRATRTEGREASLDQEGLVPLNLTKEAPNNYTDWSHVRHDLQQLKSKYLQVNDDVRRNYMQQQIGSLLALTDWCSGKPLSFRQKVRDFLYVNENPYTMKERELLHQRLETALTRRGCKGSLAEKVRAWEEMRRIPAGEIETILKGLLASAKERVVQMMFPEMEEVEVVPEVVYGVPYNAYCDYLNGKMYINGDLAYTYEALKHLVTHESFPGHTTHMRIRELGIRSGDIPLDAGLVITNTASSSVFEGIGDNGIHFIEWANSEDDRIFEMIQRIRSISGMNAAHMLHEEQKSHEDTAAFLKQFAFGEEKWIGSRLRFFTHSLRAPFIYNYWRGNEVVREVYQRVPQVERERFYHFLYKTMLSADTVKQYA